MDVLLFLFHCFHKSHRHIHPGASQHLQSYHHLAASVHVHQLAFHSCQGTFNHLHHFAGSQWCAAHFHCLFAIVQHELETLHLQVGNHGRGVLAPQHHVAAHRRECQHLRTFLRCGVYENHHRNHYACYLLTAVRPLANLLLHGQEVLDSHFREALSSLFLVT